MIDTSKVHGDELAPLDGLVRRHAVGQAPVGAGHHDGVKGHILRSEVQHQVLEPGCDLLFRNAGADLVQNFFQRFLRDPLGLLHHRQLFRAFHAAKLPQKLRGGHQLAGEGLGVKAIVPDGHVGVLKAKAGNALGLDYFLNERAVAPAGPHLVDLRVLNIALRRFNIAGVRKIPGAAAGHQSRAVRSGGVKTGGIETVGLLRQQHAVQAAALQLGRDLRKMVHDTLPFRFMMGDGAFFLL